MDSSLTGNALLFINAAREKYGDIPLDYEKIRDVSSSLNIPFPVWFTKPEYRVSRGMYKLPDVNAVAQQPLEGVTVDNEDESDSLTSQTIEAPSALKTSITSDVASYVPERNKDYVPFGFFKHLEKIISSGTFFPVFITGDSGNGKTMMVEQVCAKLKRELIIVSISIETDQTDLLGGPTLVNGNVVNRDGPVIEAMKRGAVLLLDEIDRGSNKLLCLQAIADGKPYYNKHTGEVVHAKHGFNIVATANTKGKGSEDGRYLSQILDDAFLERFPLTVEQDYPPEKVELKILNNTLATLGGSDEDFATRLVSWAAKIRKTRDDGGLDEIVSTRRLVHIVEAYSIFHDRLESIKYCINRFEDHIKTPFLELYKLVDDTLTQKEEIER